MWRTSDVADGGENLRFCRPAFAVNSSSSVMDIFIDVEVVRIEVFEEVRIHRTHDPRPRSSWSQMITARFKNRFFFSLPYAPHGALSAARAAKIYYIISAFPWLVKRK